MKYKIITIVLSIILIVLAAKIALPLVAGIMGALDKTQDEEEICVNQ